MSIKIFYLTNSLLCKCTKEMYNKPKDISESSCHQLAFNLFKHKVNSKREIANITIEGWNQFKETGHKSPFESNIILKKTFDIDDDGEIYPDEKIALIERSSFRAGLDGDSDVYIICDDKEFEEIKSKSFGYPINVIKVNECNELLQNNHKYQ